MDQDKDKPKPPPPKPLDEDRDRDEGLDEYDEELAESFPASDPPSSTQP